MSQFNTKLSISKDSYLDMETALMYAKIADKYTCSVPRLIIKSLNFNNVQDWVKERNPDTTINKFATNKVHEIWVIENDDFMLVGESINSKKQYSFDIYAINYTVQREVYDLLKSYEDWSSETYIGIYSYFMSAQGMQDSFSHKTQKDFSKLKPSFYPYLDINELFNQFIISEDNILVLAGLPGVGKTKLIDEYLNYLLTSKLVKEKIDKDKQEEKNKEILERKKIIELDTVDDIDDWIEEMETRVDTMFENDEVAVAYVKNEKIISTDEFWNQLLSKNYQLVILDDLDYALLPRSQVVSTSEDIDKNQFISQLLSYTDGIFESGNNTKFIITTNRDVSDIDSAVLRKGRTFDILNLRCLTNDEAKNIWVNDYKLDSMIFDEHFMDKDSIPSSDIGALAKDTIEAIKLNIETKPYVTEEGISQYKSLTQKNKIGLL